MSSTGCRARLLVAQRKVEHTQNGLPLVLTRVHGRSVTLRRSLSTGAAQQCVAIAVGGLTMQEAWKPYQGGLSLVGKAALPLISAGLQDLLLQGSQPALGLPVLVYVLGHELAAVDDDFHRIQGVPAQRSLEVGLIHLHECGVHFASLQHMLVGSLCSDLAVKVHKRQGCRDELTSRQHERLGHTCPKPNLAKLSFQAPGWHASRFSRSAGRLGFSGVVVAYLTHLGA